VSTLALKQPLCARRRSTLSHIIEDKKRNERNRRCIRGVLPQSPSPAFKAHRTRSFVMTSHTACSVVITRMASAAFVAIAVGIPASFAQMPMNMREGEIPTVKVNYADLNLSSEEGSRALYGRLVVAARQVCPQPSDTLLAIRLNLQAQRCVTTAVERAVKEIRNPKFAEVAASRLR
jgi:UrcA family protein